MRKRTPYTTILCTVLSVLALLTVQHLSAQHYIGVRGGYGGAMGRLHLTYGKADGTMMWNKYTGSLVWKYYSEQQVVGGVSAELEYQMRGYRIYNFGDIVSDTTRYTAKMRTVRSVTLPLIWQPHLYFAKQRLRLFVNAGFTLSYNLGINETYTVTRYGFDAVGNRMIESTTSEYKMDTARDNRWNYGICFGGGLGVLFGRWEVAAEARYYYGMSDILRTVTKYQFNQERSIRSELDNLYFTVGVFFRLGKGGIKEPPLGRRKAPPARDNDFRTIKLDGMRYRGR